MIALVGELLAAEAPRRIRSAQLAESVGAGAMPTIAREGGGAICHRVSAPRTMVLLLALAACGDRRERPAATPARVFAPSDAGAVPSRDAGLPKAMPGVRDVRIRFTQTAPADSTASERDPVVLVLSTRDDLVVQAQTFDALGKKVGDIPLDKGRLSVGERVYMVRPLGGEWRETRRIRRFFDLHGPERFRVLPDAVLATRVTADDDRVEIVGFDTGGSRRFAFSIGMPADWAFFSRTGRYVFVGSAWGESAVVDVQQGRLVWHGEVDAAAFTYGDRSFAFVRAGDDGPLVADVDLASGAVRKEMFPTLRGRYVRPVETTPYVTTLWATEGDLRAEPAFMTPPRPVCPFGLGVLAQGTSVGQMCGAALVFVSSRGIELEAPALPTRGLLTKSGAAGGDAVIGLELDCRLGIMGPKSERTFSFADASPSPAVPVAPRRDRAFAVTPKSRPIRDARAALREMRSGAAPPLVVLGKMGATLFELPPGNATTAEAGAMVLWTPTWSCDEEGVARWSSPGTPAVADVASRKVTHLPVDGMVEILYRAR